jgi:hypothetical protein
MAHMNTNVAVGEGAHLMRISRELGVESVDVRARVLRHITIGIQHEHCNLALAQYGQLHRLLEQTCFALDQRRLAWYAID